MSRVNWAAVFIITLMMVFLLGWIAFIEDHDEPWCTTGKMTLPCDSWPMKHQPVKVRITK